MTEDNTEKKKRPSKWEKKIQYATAVVSFMSGMCLGWYAYLHNGDISAGVQGFVAQCLIYTGGVFGIALYIDSKFNEVKSYLMDNGSNSKSNKD